MFTEFPCLAVYGGNFNQAERPQPLQRGQMQKHSAEARAHGRGAEVAETATRVATACSDFTQPTEHSLLLRDRPNFLFLGVERGF